MRLLPLGGAEWFFYRLPVPAGPGEAQRLERALAAARAFLAGCSLIAIWLDPTGPGRYASVAYALMLLYVGHSLLILFLPSVPDQYISGFGRITHGVDILWCVSIILFTEGPHSPFFLFFFFVLLAGAYRWGMKGTLATAGAAIGLLLGEGALLSWGPWRLLEGQFDLNRLMIRSAYLLIMGLLLGYLTEEERQLRAQISITTHLMGKARVETGLRETLGTVLHDITRLFGASGALLAVQEKRTGRMFLWECRPMPRATEIRVRLSELDHSRRETYFFACPAEVWYWSGRTGRPPDTLALDGEGRRVKNVPYSFLEPFLTDHPANSLLAVSFVFREEWWSRLFFLDPATGSGEEELRFVQTLWRRVAPAVYSAYLLRRLRHQAGAMERARVARELHDGAIQSLSAIEMKVDVLRRRAGQESPSVSGELAQIQQLLRQEVVDLRELMEQMRPLDLRPPQLLDFLADSVEKFRRETGIHCVFVSDLEEVVLPPRVCRELGRIVQEALTNVRKHSGARHVLVRLTSRDGNWKLEVDDDGRGFPFSGRLSQSELDAARRGPLVIKERVRSIGGELTVESLPGQGARLEITLPQAGPLP